MEEEKKIEQGVVENVGQPAMEEERSSFDIKRIFTIIVLNWQWFLLSMIICVSGAMLYLRTQRPVYQVTAKMLIKDDASMNNRRASNQMLSNMQDLGIISNSAGIDNEVEILMSHILAEQAVKELKLYTEYFSKGRIREVLVYKNQPINVDLDSISLAKLDEQMRSFTFTLTREGNKYVVDSEDGSVKGSFSSLPDTLATKWGTLKFTQNEDFEMGKGTTMIVKITAPTAIANRYVGSLSVSPTSKMTSIAQLVINDESTERGVDYLLKLAECYNEQANEDKNEVVRKTKEFINDRMREIELELSLTEKEIERYKRDNNLVQLRLDATQTTAQANNFTDRLTEAQVQLQILDDLRKYVDNMGSNHQLIPSNVGLTDGSSAQLIAEYNKTVLERDNLLKAVANEAPQIAKLNDRLNSLKVAIKEALKQARHTAEIQKQGIKKQYDMYQSRIEDTPEQERVLTEIGRQQEVKSNLYVLLLQKELESEMSLAATADKGKLIDKPVPAGKVSPKSTIIMMVAIILGFAIPLLLFFLIQILRYKIEGHDDVLRQTRLPIVADVAVASESAKSSAGIVVKENENNTIDEIFRSMRTNIQFMLQGDQKVILFTSTTSGEGKTFNAANLAVSFALLGKKVILLGLDIRKPALGRLFDMKDRSKGITSLLVREQVTRGDLDAIIQPSGVNNNLDLLLAGPVPPNPTELLARENLGTIISILREEYDYVILDTAPVGLVTDTLEIGKYADVTAYICRADYTPKSSFRIINSLAEEKKLPNMCIILNGVDMSKKKYGYYYGYGRYGKYGRYINSYNSYGGYSSYGTYGGYGYGGYGKSHYGKKDDTSIKR